MFEHRVTQLGYVGFGVSSIERWREFAGDVLGLQENGTGPNGELFLRLDEYHHRFILTPTGEDDITLAGWEVKDAVALKAVCERLRGLGIEVTDATPKETDARMVLGLARFKDPDGIANELYYGPCISEQPFLSPQVASGFTAAGLGLGHIVRAIGDEGAYMRLLLEGLGARTTDHVSIGGSGLMARFFHVNPRHHSIAIAAIPPMPGVGPGKRLHHFMVEVRSLDDVGRALDRAQRRGFPTGVIGRHPNDHMISAYFRTPSGFDVEYGTAGRTILNDDEWEVVHYRHESSWGHGPVREPSTTTGHH